MGTTLNKPLSPALVEAKLVKGQVQIRWSKTDPRSVTYTVSKKYRKNMFDVKNEDFEGIKGDEFLDGEIYAGVTYYYTVYGVDKNYIKSEPSIEVMIETDKNDSNLKQEVVEEIKDVDMRPIIPETLNEVVDKDVVIINKDFN